jgi:ATP-dependent Clp protease ATP-binding subunit ClpB
VDSGSSMFLPGFPAFANELAGTLAVHAQYVLHGNIRDQFLVTTPDRPPVPTPMLRLLWQALRGSGYQALICYDPVDGVTVHPPEDSAARRAAESVLGSRVIGRRPPLEKLRAHLAKAVGVPEQPPLDAEVPAQSQQQPGQPTEPAAGVLPSARVAFVIDYAARITRLPGQLDPVERDFFLYCQKLAFSAKPLNLPGPRPGPLYNPVIWLVEGERDLPAWLTAGVEPIRTIAVGMPTLDEREELARVLAPMFPSSSGSANGTADRDPAREFANRTDGMTLKSMMDITKLAKDRGIGADRVADATRIYKLGVDDNPWRKTSVRKQITDGEKMIFGKIRGQDRAISKTLDILKRAALGLSGAHVTSTASRPRGVLFFAGPTGVGKTELAKQTAGILFGDEQAYLRFDMSEFAAEQAADRLVGAPPGYVGFEAGGELTGAVRRKPFQVILFDEIEKAHPLVLDKFLQILEDGRLTDGQGVTTHFSECVLIFTSNLGIIVTNPETGRRERIVEPGMPYATLEAKVKAAIREHFTTTIARPELLNRLGDNVVIFNFIDKEIAGEIFAIQLDNVVTKVQSELGIRLRVTDHAREQLREVCTSDLENGGRGIGNLLESNLINPLTRVLFDRDCGPGAEVTVTGHRKGDDDSGPVLETSLAGVP